MRIDIPGRQFQYRPTFRNPMNTRAPAAPPPRQTDQTLGNIAGVMAAGSQLLGQVMSVADTVANARAQRALPGMFEEAGAVFDEMEGYDGDDFREQLQVRLDEVFASYADEYSGMTRDVIEAKWGQWKAQRVDQFETQINSRNRELEMNGIVAEIRNPQTSRQEREILAESLVNKRYMSEQQARELVVEVDRNLFIQEQSERFAQAESEEDVLALTEQDAEGNWVVEFDGRDVSLEDRTTIMQTAGQIIENRNNIMRAQMVERSQALSDRLRQDWAAAPGSITPAQVARYLENDLMISEHYNYWMNKIEAWNADQTPTRTDIAQAEDAFKNNLFSIGVRLAQSGVNEYGIAENLYRIAVDAGYGEMVADDVMDDLRSSLDNLEGEEQVRALIAPFEEIAPPDMAAEVQQLRQYLRRELTDAGRPTEEMRARVQAEIIKAQEAQVRSTLEGGKRRIRLDVFSNWDNNPLTREIDVEEDMEVLHPIERVVMFSSFGGLASLREEAPERAAEVESYIQDLKPNLDVMARTRRDLPPGEYNPQTGQITYTDERGRQFRPVIRQNRVVFERITQEPARYADAADFLDDLRVELGMFQYMRIADDGNIYGVWGGSGRDGEPQAQRLRQATPREMQQFLSLGGSTTTLYPTRRFQGIMEIRYE